MNGKRFKDLPPDVQKKIANKIFESIKSGQKAGAFGMEIGKELSSVLGEVGFLEADISDIIRTVAEDTGHRYEEHVARNNNNKDKLEPNEETYTDQLKEQRSQRKELLRTRNNHMQKLRSLVGSVVIDTILLEEDKFFNNISERIKDLRHTVQQIDKDLNDHSKDVLDKVQFVESDRLMLYNIREVIHNCLSQWTKELLLIHRGVSETLDTLDMIKSVIPAALGELEADKKEKGV